MAGVGEKIMVSAFTGVIGPLLGKLSKLMEEFSKVKGRQEEGGVSQERADYHQYHPGEVCHDGESGRATSQRQDERFAGSGV